MSGSMPTNTSTANPDDEVDTTTNRISQKRWPQSLKWKQILVIVCLIPPFHYLFQEVQQRLSRQTREMMKSMKAVCGKNSQRIC